MFLPNWDNTGVTVELGDIVASGVDVWAFDYPVPAETVTYNGKTAKVPFDKKAFEQKILDHYRFRQIGQETVGRWLHYFRTRIREIMPYYVQLYEFEAKWFNIDDPLESYNLVETFEESSSGSERVTGSNSSESSSESSGTARANKSGNVDSERRFSDTPQGSIDNLDSYLTEATREGSDTSENSSEESTGTATVTGSDTSESSSENQDNTTHTLTRRGNIGVQPLGTEVKNIRDAFINIDLMVINELNDLFIQVY
ncbi:MAG: hypothetical protein J6J12_00195 [Oscillospiraceae bacterium]|nr:hypothetical protein [Oscillospiraceae bacterium]